MGKQRQKNKKGRNTKIMSKIINLKENIKHFVCVSHVTSMVEQRLPELKKRRKLKKSKFKEIKIKCQNFSRCL